MPESKVNPVLDLKLKLDHEHPFLAECGITPEVAEAFGIGFADRGIMKDRIAIPIHNERGELVAYAGRYAKEDVPDGTLRYRLPKTFFKSLVLYNLHRAKEFEKRHVVIVEGFWSAVRLHRDGIPAVALMGTSCSPEQAELLRSAGFRFATLLLDGDDAGRKATPELLAVLSKKIYVRTVELPDGDKPDTMNSSLLDGLR